MKAFFVSLGITTIYTLVLQIFYSLQILPFRNFLEQKQKRQLAACWAIMVLLEIIGFQFLLGQDIFPSHAAAYWAMGYVGWLPPFLLSLWFTKPFWIGHLFILSFRILLTSCFYTFMRYFFLAAFPDTPFEDLYLEEILFYGGLCLISFPFLLRFFTNVFSHFQEASTRRYWRSITIIPMLLAIDTLYISLYDSQEQYFSLLGARFFLLAVIVLLMASVRSGQVEVYEELDTYEKNHTLHQQLVSAANYVEMSRDSKRRMAAIYQERREHLTKLLTFVQCRDRDGVLAYIESLGTEFDRTKLPRYCQNVLINAALTVYLSRAKEEGIPVTAAVDLPEEIPFSGDLSIVLSNLLENALLASRRQPPDCRNITVVARRQGGMLNILVKNLFAGFVPLDGDGLPVTHVTGHGLGMKSLARFRDKYEAGVLCQQKDGWFITYLQVSMAPAESLD